MFGVPTPSWMLSVPEDASSQEVASQEESDAKRPRLEDTSGLDTATLVEEYLKNEGIDEKASEYMRSSTEEVQRAVLAQGTLAGMRSPSGALTSRIRAAEQQLWKLPDNTKLCEAVEQFLNQEEGIDEQAADYLRKSSPMVQRAVLEQGGLNGARSPSGALTSRIRAAEVSWKNSSAGWMPDYVSPWWSSPGTKGGKGGGAGSQAQGRYLSDKDVDSRVEEFLVENAEVDDKAADYLRKCPTHVKQYVLDLGGLGGARSPSGALTTRIKNAMMWGGGCGAFGPGQMAPWEPPQKFQSKDSFAGWTIERAVEEFLASVSVDEASADFLRKAPPQAQRIVLDQGGLNGAASPSAALTTRVKAAIQTVGGPPWLPGGTTSMPTVLDTKPTEEEVESFLRRVDVDEKAQDFLRKAPPAVQRAVLQQGGLGHATCPSGALTSRIIRAMQQARAAAASGGWSSGCGCWPSAGSGGCGWGGCGASGAWNMNLEQAVEEFLSQTSVDDKAADFLRKSPPDVQRAVLDIGGLEGARSPSGALTSRIKNVLAQRGPRSLAEEVDLFLHQEGVDNNAQEYLRRAPAQVQRMVLDQGGLRGARTPSGALTGRINAALAATGLSWPATGPSSSPDVGGGGCGGPAAAVWQEPMNSGPAAMAWQTEGCGLDGSADSWFGAPWSPCSAGWQQSDSWNQPGDAMGLGMGTGMGGGMGAWQPGPSVANGDGMMGHTLDSEMEQFLAQPGVDEQAADYFRKSSPMVQRAVMEQGPLAGARNISGALTSRIRTATAALSAQGW